MICRYETIEHHLGSPLPEGHPQWFYELEDEDVKELKEIVLDHLRTTGELLEEVYLPCEVKDEDIIFYVKDYADEFTAREVFDAFQKYYAKI